MMRHGMEAFQGCILAMAAHTAESTCHKGLAVQRGPGYPKKGYATGAMVATAGLQKADCSMTL